MHRVYPYLMEEAELLRRRAEKLREDCYDSPVTASLSGMPFGGQTSDTTARVALDEDTPVRLAEASSCDVKAQQVAECHLDISSRLRLLTREERLVLCAMDFGVPTPMWMWRHRVLVRGGVRSERWWYYTLARARSRMKR